MPNLDDILDDKPEEEAEPAETKAQEDDAPEPVEAEDATDDAGSDEPAEDDGEKDEPEPQGKQVPLGALLDVRDENKALKKQLEELQAKQSQQPDLSQFYKKGPEKIPSQFEDEDGYTKALTDKYQADMANRTFAISLDNARQTFGDERVNTALLAFGQAAQSNPLLMQAAEASPNPVREIVNWYDQQQFVSRMDEFDPILQAGSREAYEEALKQKWLEEFKASAPRDEQAAEDEAQPEPEKPKLPGNFNRGGKGGVNKQPVRTSLNELLG